MYSVQMIKPRPREVLCERLPSIETLRDVCNKEVIERGDYTYKENRNVFLEKYGFQVERDN